MKKRLLSIFMAVAAAGMMFTSCNNDPEDLIVGTWTLDGAKSYASHVESYQGETWGDTIYMTDMQVTMTFNADGSVYGTETYGDRSHTDTASYTITDDKLVIDGEDHDIQTLTKKSLILHDEEDETNGEMTVHFIDHMEFTR